MVTFFIKTDNSNLYQSCFYSVVLCFILVALSLIPILHIFLYVSLSISIFLVIYYFSFCFISTKLLYFASFIFCNYLFLLSSSVPSFFLYLSLCIFLFYIYLLLFCIYLFLSCIFTFFCISLFLLFGSQFQNQNILIYYVTN